MKSVRAIRKVLTGKKTADGAGVRLVRVFGQADTADFDPFLMLDAFDSTNPADYVKGFPWHPHRGIETITYLISGTIEHGDSLGTKGSIHDGECQWMTAGSGIIHQEMPKENPRLFGAQLWLNLPAASKMVRPRYHWITQEEIPEVSEGGACVHILAGKYLDRWGAYEGNYIKPLYLDVELKSGTDWTLATDPEHTLFLYILEGSLFFPADKVKIDEKHAVLFQAGSLLQVKASEKGARFLLLSGQPLREPIAWGGPIVMNTQEELQNAFRELDRDTFIK